MFILQPFLECVHFIKKFFFYTFTLSSLIGRVVLYIVASVYCIVSDFIEALKLIGEEFYRFICELNAGILEALDYGLDSTNTSINVFINGIGIILNHCKSFFATTSLHTKLLTTRIGQGIAGTVALLYGALLLIADTCFWLLALIPRLIFYILVQIGDILIFTISTTWFGAFYLVKTLISDIFRLSISIVVVALLWSRRRKLLLVLKNIYRKIKTVFNGAVRQSVIYVRNSYPFSRNRLRFVPPPRTDRALIFDRHSLSPNSNDKLPESQRCVVCRDRPKNVVLWPCRHLCLCERCATVLINMQQNALCPLCREELEQFLPIYV